MSTSSVVIDKFERSQMRDDVPAFRPGDTIRVNFRVREGERERLQGFEGICLKRNGGGFSETVTVRKVSSGIGVERTFFLHSPLVESVSVIRQGFVRRSRLYYLRERFGKRARVAGAKRFMSGKKVAAETAANTAPVVEAESAPAVPAAE